MVLALSQVVQAYNMRSDRSLFAIGPFSNHKLNWAALASTALVALVLFTPVGIAFGLVTLPWQYYLLGLGLILAPLLVMEIAKLCRLTATTAGNKASGKLQMRTPHKDAV